MGWVDGGVRFVVAIIIVALAAIIATVAFVLLISAGMFGTIFFVPVFNPRLHRSTGRYVGG